MFYAVNLGGLRHHDRSTLLHDLIAYQSHQRIGCHARPAIAAAAFHSDHQLGDGLRRALNEIGLRQQLFYGSDAGLDRFACPA